jgi:predicted NAD/FAD-dependent oxidoreductase
MRGANPAESKQLAQEMATAALLADFRSIATSLSNKLVPEPVVSQSHRWGSGEGVLTAETMAQLGLEQEQQCFVDREAHFVACGDYFVAPKVSGAALSGQGAAQQVLTMLQ